MRLNRRVPALRAGRLQTNAVEGRAFAIARCRALRIARFGSLPLPSAPAPLAKALPSTSSRGRLWPSPYPSTAYAKPGYAGLSSGVWRRFGRVAAAGERGQPLSLTLTPAALSRGLVACWDYNFAKVSRRFRGHRPPLLVPSR